MARCPHFTLPPHAPSGIYELQIVPTFGTVGGAALNPLATLVRYERRNVSTDGDRAEIKRREMMHAYINGSDTAMDAATGAL
jgi:hypothetical protein